MISISVIMSVYKEPLEWLRQSIDSILHQTFSDFEFIVICDNPDYSGGLELLKAYSEKDPRVVLLINEKNVGLTKSLNKGLRIAKGKYIARMDADDISDLHRLQIQYDFMEENPDIAVCGTGRNILNVDKQSRKTYNSYSKSDDIMSVFVLRSAFTHPTVMFRRSIVDEGFSYDESFICAQDYDLWERLLEYGYSFANIDMPLLNYRMSDNQVSKNKKDIQVTNAKRVRNNFLSSLGIILKEEELNLLVLPFVKNIVVTKTMVKNYLQLLQYLQKELEKEKWFNVKAYQTEAVRFAINLALRSNDRVLCLWDIFRSPQISYFAITNNINYYLHRL